MPAMNVESREWNVSDAEPPTAEWVVLGRVEGNLVGSLQDRRGMA